MEGTGAWSRPDGSPLRWKGLCARIGLSAPRQGLTREILAFCAKISLSAFTALVPARKRSGLVRVR